MNTKTINIGFLKLAIIASVFSQIEAVESIFRPLMYVTWLAIIVIMVFERSFIVGLSRFAKMNLALYVGWLAICLAASMFGTEHLSGNYLRIMMVPILVTITANLYKENYSEQLLVSICRLYVVCALVFAVWVNVNYFSSYSEWLRAQVYSFAQKNSAAQIWSSSLLMICFIIKPKGWRQKAIWYAIGLYLLLITALSQCRTALLGLGFAMAVYIIRYTKYRFVAIVSALLIGFVAWNTPEIRRFINQVFFLEKYAGADLNTMSSYRLDYWKEAITAFDTSPLLGVGEWYVDCSYLSVLAEGGLIGFIIIESIWLGRIITIAKSNSTRRRFLVVLICFYLVESALEGFPPFGPGVSSFMFWMISEFIVNETEMQPIY